MHSGSHGNRSIRPRQTITVNFEEVAQGIYEVAFISSFQTKDLEKSPRGRDQGCHLAVAPMPTRKNWTWRNRRTRMGATDQGTGD